jgi:L-serine dehydratase
MESIRELYRIGNGPSSSHTMGPKSAAETFHNRNAGAQKFVITLFGSLAATGKGHLTDKAITSVFKNQEIDIIWKMDEELPRHPNGMRFEAFDSGNLLLEKWEVYSVGGGALEDEKSPGKNHLNLYDMSLLSEILNWCEDQGEPFWAYVKKCEGETIFEYIEDVWETMEASINKGLDTEGALPGPLGIARRASSISVKAANAGQLSMRTGKLSAYALAVAEQNASGGTIVTAPTCGSSGVVPAVVKYVSDTLNSNKTHILQALATAGLIGNIVKHNASVSGAEVGCQGEVGTACAMAAGAAAQLMGGSVRQIEYAAEMGLEHHLGLTCDPVAGMVQIPCIERNAFAATRALTCAEYALFTDGNHRISFDEVVAVMKTTGHDLPSLYRETSTGGLATIQRMKDKAVAK